MTNNDAWLGRVEAKVKAFSARYRILYSNKTRERAASFEIGCLHMLLGNYSKVGGLEPQNLTDQGEFRYLTSPNGNPANFSWIKFSHETGDFQIRQQVRVKSHWSEDIAFCPDIVVLKPNTQIENEKPSDFANGKRPFYSVKSSEVISAHECKSLSPFPELLVSFIGLFQAAHSWYDHQNPNNHAADKGVHLAPCLFVGGDSRPIQRRMINAIENKFPVNIVTGIHWGRFKLSRKYDRAKYLYFAKPVSKGKTPYRRILALET